MRNKVDWKGCLDVGSTPTDSIIFKYFRNFESCSGHYPWFAKRILIYERTWKGWVKATMYELLLEDLLEELENNGIDTSKLKITEDTGETEKNCINYFAPLVK